MNQGKRSCHRMCGRIWSVPLPSTDTQWVGLAAALTFLTYLSLLPPPMMSNSISFVAPTRADLLLPARNKEAHLDRKYRTSVINRVAAMAPSYCGYGDWRDRPYLRKTSCFTRETKTSWWTLSTYISHERTTMVGPAQTQPGAER